MGGRKGKSPLNTRNVSSFCLLKNTDVIPNAFLLVLSNAFRDPGDVADFLEDVSFEKLRFHSGQF